MKIHGCKNDVHYGEISDEEPDWRDGTDEIDPDDEELPVTPQSVIDVLGFDPKELSPRKKGSLISNTTRALMILNAWSDKARRAARAKRASKGLKKGFQTRLKKRVEGKGEEAAKKIKAYNKPLTEKQRAKKTAELSKEIQGIRDSYQSTFKSIEKRLKKSRKQLPD